MNRKRILFSAYAFYPEFGGLEQQVYLLSQEFIELGHDVTVLTEKSLPKSKSSEEIDGIHVTRVTYAKKRTILDYLRLISEISAYIIQNRNSFDIIYLRAALTLYPLLFSFWKTVGVLKCPIIATADTGGDRDEVIQVLDWPLSRVMIYFFKHFDYFNSICNANFKHYQQLGLPSDQLTRIPNGIHTDKFRKSRYPKRVKNFLFLGRFILEKGLIELVEAMTRIHADCPDVKLHLAGEGPALEQVRDLITSKRMNNWIITHGKLDAGEREKFFSLGDCLVLPSYSEGMPLVVLEAAVSKKVIISTDVGDLKELFGNQILFCEKRSVPSLERTMKNALSTDFTDKLDYEKIVKKVDIKDVARQYLDLLS